MKESQLGFELKGIAQDLKGACPGGRWPVAPFSCTSQTSLNPYTCTLGMFHPAAQLVRWTQSQEHVMGDKFGDAGVVPSNTLPVPLAVECVTWMKVTLVTQTRPISFFK